MEFVFLKTRQFLKSESTSVPFLFDNKTPTPEKKKNKDIVIIIPQYTTALF